MGFRHRELTLFVPDFIHAISFFLEESMQADVHRLSFFVNVSANLVPRTFPPLSNLKKGKKSG